MKMVCSGGGTEETVFYMDEIKSGFGVTINLLAASLINALFAQSDT